MMIDNLGNSDEPTIFTSNEESHCNINNLPLELLVEIFCNVEPEQLAIVRLVCRRWNHAVSDKSTWISAFSGKFGTPLSSFPTVSGSSLWMVEYLARLQVVKKWRRGTASHRTYQLINNELGAVDSVVGNFSNEHGRLLTFSRRFGNVALCTLQTGKNEGYIPGGRTIMPILSYDINGSYLLVGKSDGRLYLRNLTTATSGGGSSTLELSSVVGDGEARDGEPGNNDSRNADNSGHPISCVLLNSNLKMDRHKVSVDIISGDVTGVLRTYNLSGKCTSSLELSQCILNIKSDFKEFIVVNSNTRLYLIQFNTLEVLASVVIPEVEITHETISNIGVQFGQVSHFPRNQLDVHFGSMNVVFCYKKSIVVFDMLDASNIREKSMQLGGLEVIQSEMQTPTVQASRGVNVHVAGKNGVLYANVLSDNSVIVWNICDWGNDSIVPQCKIFPEFNKNAPDTRPHEIRPITTISLNSTIIAVAGYNGYVNIHNVFTGEFIREASIRMPRRYAHMFTHLIPVDRVLLSSNQMDACGVIVSGDMVQYFQFGNKNVNPVSISKKKYYVAWEKQERKNNIKDEMEEFDSQRWEEKERNALYDKYNGVVDDDELALAIALSESEARNGEESAEVEGAIEESRQLHLIQGGSLEHEKDLEEELSEDEQLRRIIELSLIEH